MRKLFFTILLSLTTLSSNAQMIKLGDINRDNQVSVNDVMALVDIILNGYSPFSVSPTDVTMQAGGTANVTIWGGYYIYEVVSDNTDIVTATLNGLTVTLTAVAGGKTNVTVKDVLTLRAINIPVNVEYGALQISNNELSLVVNEQGIVEINSGSGYYSVQSSDESVATAKLEGFSIKVTAEGGGTATITVTDSRSGQTATIAVTVEDNQPQSTCPDNHHPHLIDLGLPSGTKWACCNIGADKPEDCGGYYAWAETEEKSVYNSMPPYLHGIEIDDEGDGWLGDCHSGSGAYGIRQNIGNDIAGTQYDVAHMKWGDSWVMPSYTQQGELLDNCTSTWTTQNGVKGRLFTGINGCSIFFPAAGYLDGSNLSSAGSEGYYWSSMRVTDWEYAFGIYFHESGYTYANDYYTNYGFSVRPVVRN